MNRYSRSIQKVAAKPAHPYELRIDSGDGVQKIPFDDLDTLKSKYPLDFLRRENVAVVDMRDKPKSIFL